MDLRPVFLLVGILVTALSAGMGVPAAVDAFAGHDDWQVFALSASVTLFVGVAMILTCRVFVTAVSIAATAICNVGPALGPVVGPAGDFQSLPDAAKWLLAAGMVLGRLELFTVLMLFSPAFWRG